MNTFHPFRQVIFTILIFISFATHLSATHIRGGEITYTRLSASEYCFTLHFYTDITPGNADSPQVTFDFGDGSPAVVVARTSFVEDSAVGFLGISTYEVCHTFAGAGNYMISIVEENRDAGIININNGNSVIIPFATRTELNIDPNFDQNDSPIFLGVPFFGAKVDEIFQQNMLAFDPQGDSLSYSLVAPLQTQDQNVPNYFRPMGLEINQLSGELIWDRPQMAGLYTFAVRIEKWRNGTLLGVVQRDLQIVVENTDDELAMPQIISNDPSLDLNNADGARVEPAQSLSFSVVFPDNDQDSTVNPLKAYGEAIQNGGAQLQVRDSTDTNGLSYKIAQIDWEPSNEDTRAYPYVFTFRMAVASGSLNLQRDLTLLFYVGSAVIPSEGLVTASPAREVYEKSIKIFPNPSKDYLKLEFAPVLAQAEKEIRIYSFAGKILSRLQVGEGDQTELSLTSLPVGTYFIEILVGGETVYRQTLIKQ